MGRRNAVVFVSVVMLVLGGASAAIAGTPGHWTPVTNLTARNIDEVSVARTPDGNLHAVWERPTPANPNSGQDLLQRSISPSGVAGTPVVIESNWAAMENPAVVATGGSGLDAFVGAIRSTNTSDPIGNLAFVSSADGGASWTLDPADVTNTGAAYASNVAAALGSDGTPFITWGSSSCLCVHRGTAQTPNSDFQQGLGDFGYDPGIALDPASGQLVAAWYSNGTGHNGIYAAAVDQATGARIGTPMQMPGTSSLADGPFNGRTPIVARAGGGLYVAYEGAYPVHSKVLLWRVGAATSALLGKSTYGVRSVGVASTPTGRLWVYWSAQSPSGSPTVYARRSNPQATAWGPAITVSPPGGANSSWNLVGNGQSGRLDLLGSFTVGNSSIGTFHTQVLPGLALSASRTHLNVGAANPQNDTFLVTDAGSPLAGVLVQVGAKHGTTNGNGKVTLALGPFAHKAHLLAKASRNGYVGAAVKLTAK
jgi:hypothetical protein